MNSPFLRLICLGFFSVGVAAHAGPISKVPARISKPGKYYLIANVTPKATAVAEEGAAIVIDADNVELDLQGFSVVGNPANAAINIGILVSGKEGIRIRNGRVLGFATGLNGGFGAKDGLFEGLEIKSTLAPATSRTMGSHFRNCTFILDSNAGDALHLASSGGGPAHLVEFCSFYATSLGAGVQRGVAVAGTQPTIIRNCQFISFGLGISGNNITSAADNVFQNCPSKLDAGVTNPVGYNQ
jgi:hypothetical protein